MTVKKGWSEYNWEIGNISLVACLRTKRERDGQWLELWVRFGLNGLLEALGQPLVEASSLIPAKMKEEAEKRMDEFLVCQCRTNFRCPKHSTEVEEV